MKIRLFLRPDRCEGTVIYPHCHMASHGVPRTRSAGAKTGNARLIELDNIKEYQSLVELVNTKIRDHQYTIETLDLISKVLKWNPEYYTIWNHRRLVLQHQLSFPATTPPTEPTAGQGFNKGRYDSPLDLITGDLQFLVPLLRKFPKCYWIWNYRLWLLQQSTAHLFIATALKLWREELGLIDKMLSLDSRNFHGWGYRRTVIAALESSGLDRKDHRASSGAGWSRVEDEFTYTTKMIKTDLSNFSAWHSRTKLIPRLLDERKADIVTRRGTLDDELALIKEALYTDPYDQSLWFYHAYLMCTFDPKIAQGSMVPNLTNGCRVGYVIKELEMLQDLRECAEDCKWVYQALLQYTTLQHLLKGESLAAVKGDLAQWLSELRKLDPLRNGRWDDLCKNLDVETEGPTPI